MKGIDIYNGTGTVDFNAVKSAGYEFVITKSSEGHTLRDNSLSRNLTEAAKAGLHTGVYHWFWGRSESETDQEIEFFLSVIRGCKMEMPVALDVEQIDLAGLGKDKLTSYVKRWLDGVKAAGYYPMIYTNLNWSRNYLDMSRLADYDIWLAQYNDKMTYTGAGTVGIWQYSSSGKVPGVKGGTGNCDVNICYKEYPQIIRAGGWNNYPKPAAQSESVWDTKSKKMTVGQEYAALCTSDATVEILNPEIAAIKKVQPGYTARSGKTGDLYTIRALQSGNTEITATLNGITSGFPVIVG